MKNMKLNPTYAVVDIETTQSLPDGSKRIIQFSCTLVKHGKIINEFNTLVNPGVAISSEIVALTHIDNAAVAQAPLFDDVAATIYNLLQDTTFVAHNIAFDWNFLNAELTRCGLPELTLPGLDTVQITQILYPTLPSYRLQDLSKHFGFDHKNPHRADSDAHVTALLLILLRQRVAQLPQALLEQMLPLMDGLAADSKQFFTQAAASPQAPAASDEVTAVGRLVLAKPKKAQLDAKTSFNYPHTKDQKEALFADQLTYRDQQAQMMDATWHFFEQRISGQKFQILAAPTGTGKTLGYLLPAMYWAKNHHQPIVIATATLTLQDQLQTQLRRLTNLAHVKLNWVNLKAAHHYIDISRFAQTLVEPNNEVTRLLQLQIMVWLSTTQTGDLAELRQTNLNAPLFKAIEHHGWQSLNEEDQYYHWDFIARQVSRLQTADVVITNHYYLLANAQQFSAQPGIPDVGSTNHHSVPAVFARPEAPFSLIIDEADRFAAAAVTNSEVTLDFDLIKIITDTLLVKMQSTLNPSLNDYVAAGVITPTEMKRILRLVRYLNTVPYALRAALLQQFFPVNHRQATTQQVIAPNKMYGWLKSNAGEIEQAARTLPAVMEWAALLTQRLHVHHARLTTEEVRVGQALIRLFNSLKQAMTVWEQLTLTHFEQLDLRQKLVWLSYAATQENAHVRLHFGLAQTTDYLGPNVYRHFSQTLLVGAAFSQPLVQKYLMEQLDIPQTTPLKQYASGFDYGVQAVNVVVKDGCDASKVPASTYEDYLADQILTVAQASNKNTLVLFTAQATLEAVYDRLHTQPAFARRPLLAQGVSGSVEKIKKRFMLADNAVLLGTGSFWQGIDLPDTKLELLVITRLPFMPPDTIFNQVRFQAVQKKGANPFKAISLPEACLQLNQGFGRLIRSPHDTGVCVVLDSRLVTRKYNKELRQAFPAELPWRTVTQAALFTAVQQALQQVRAATN